MIYNRSLRDDYLHYKNDKDNLIPFLLGRNAINYLIRSLEIKAILLPTYICSMVVDIFKYYEIEVFFYENLNKKFEVPLSDILIRVDEVKSEKKLFFLWHDYLNIIGDMPDELYDFLEKSNIEVIIDATHSLPIKKYKCQNVVYGFRKLLNQPFGSLLKVGKEQSQSLTELSFKKIWRFLIFHKISTYIYLTFRGLNNNLINRFLIILSTYGERFSFDKHDIFLYDIYKYKKIIDQHNSLDYEKISQKRRRNFLQYSSLISNKLNLDNFDISCPYGFPLIVEDNQQVRKKLWEMGIHSFILWDTLHEDLSQEESKYFDYLSNSNLILPVNQDLSSNDIDRIINILNV
jgi:hypothetical protein